MSLRLEKKYSRDVSLYDPIGTDKEGNVISLVDVIEAEETDVVDQVQRERDVQAMYRAYETCLKEKEKYIVSLRYGLFGCREHTQKEIAGQLGISRSYV